MTIEELHRTVVDGLSRVDERFVATERRFDAIDERFDAIDGRFDAIDEKFDAIDEKFDAIDEKFDAIDEKFDRLEAKVGRDLQVLRSDLEARIKEEGATTRRHFDVMVEKVEAAVRIVAEGHIHLETVVDNHEARLRSLEKRP